jgi:hypothetical protein
VIIYHSKYFICLLIDDIDITHAISISSLLKVTVYDKSTINQQNKQPSSQLQASWIEMRDTLNNLIKSFKTADEDKEIKASATSTSEKAENNKAIRRLTPAELGTEAI